MTNFLYAGFSNITLDEDFDFGHGIILRKTYAHIMAHNIMAFSPALPNKPHPGPWKAAQGGSALDIMVELCVPTSLEELTEMKAEDVVWWIAALLRIVGYPFLVVSVISDTSFSEIVNSEKEPLLHPFETTPRVLNAASSETGKLAIENLNWVKDKWYIAVQLSGKDSSLKAAINAWDFSALSGRTSASMLAVWGALEQLFSRSVGEIRFRVSANIASFLESSGTKRLELYKEMLSLYNERSKAAHTAKDVDQGAWLRSWIVLRNALVKIIDDEKIPEQSDFENLLFCPEILTDKGE